MKRDWPMTPLLKATVVVHGSALAGSVATPSLWPWALAAVVANHVALTAAGLLPRSQALGPNLVRLPAPARARQEIALTIDDGPDPEVTPRVLDVLDAAGAKASFFCIGRRARQAPVLCREIVARGHRVENHGESHSNAFALFGPGRMRADISAAQSALSDITGQAPQFFRPTAGLRNPFLEPVLAGLGLQLASWTRRPYDTVRGNPQAAMQHLTRDLAAGDILLLHDGHAARTPTGVPVVLAVLPDFLNIVGQRSLKPVTLTDALIPT
jgi:peptidoglycan-N-acetylglucosamine deacetylase